VIEIHYNQSFCHLKLENNESSPSCSENVYRGLVVCRTEEGVSVVNVVSESEMLVKFVT